MKCVLCSKPIKPGQAKAELLTSTISSDDTTALWAHCSCLATRHSAKDRAADGDDAEAADADGGPTPEPKEVPISLGMGLYPVSIDRV